MPVSEVHGGPLDDGVSGLDVMMDLLCWRAHQNDGVSGLEVVTDLLCWRCVHAHMRLTGSEASLEPQ